MRHLWWCDDASDRHILDRLSSSPLHLLDLRPEGKDGLQGALDPHGKLDGLVTEHLVERLLNPERLATLLSSLKARRASKAESEYARMMALQPEVTEADERLKRLYRLVEDGVTDLDEVLKGRLDSLKTDRERARSTLEAIKG